MFAEITSANVVGYQDVVVPAGSSMRTATFKAITGDYKISDIKVAGVFDGIGDEYGQKVNADGTWGDTYYYLLAEGGMAEADGWYKDPTGGEPVTDEDMLTVGQAFIFSSSADLTFTYAGEVISGTADVSVPAGTAMVGNPTPVAAKFSEIQVAGTFDGIGDEYGQKVNDDGTWGDTYYYLLADGGMAEEDGWYKDPTGGEPVTDDDVLEPADAMIFSSSADLVLSFPAVL